jgi:hypothetical protein
VKYKYFVENDGETAEDAIPVYHKRFDPELCEFVKDYQFAGDHQDVAEHAAKQHRRRSFLDWNDGARRISIVDEGGVVETFDVSLEYEPTFNASKCK